MQLGYFPGDGRAGLDLGPANFRVLAAAVAALGHEVEDAAAALRVAGIPVLDGRVLDLGTVVRDQLDHGGVELILVAHRRGAALEVAHVGALVGDDESALELAGVLLIDAVSLRRAASRATIRTSEHFDVFPPPHASVFGCSARGARNAQ